MKKILFLSLAIFALQTYNVDAATVSTTKYIVKCQLTGQCDPSTSELWYECDSTFTTNKDAYAPSENVIVNVSQAGSMPPGTMTCISTLNAGSQVTGNSQPLTSTIITLTDGQSYSHAAPSTPGNYTQSVSATYQCKPGYPNCEMTSTGQDAYAFPNFSEAFLPFTVSSYECNDGVDNSDPEDTLADSADPGCHSDNNPSNGASYIPTGSTEVDSLTLQLHGRYSFLLNQLDKMFTAIQSRELARK